MPSRTATTVHVATAMRWRVELGGALAMRWQRRHGSSTDDTNSEATGETFTIS
jgi:hypothetical protein